MCDACAHSQGILKILGKADADICGAQLRAEHQRLLDSFNRTSVVKRPSATGAGAGDDHGNGTATGRESGEDGGSCGESPRLDMPEQRRGSSLGDADSDLRMKEMRKAEKEERVAVRALSALRPTHTQMHLELRTRTQ